VDEVKKENAIRWMATPHQSSTMTASPPGEALGFVRGISSFCRGKYHFPAFFYKA
jgi:hypothetical protein